MNWISIHVTLRGYCNISSLVQILLCRMNKLRRFCCRNHRVQKNLADTIACNVPDSKVNGANIRSIWGQQDPGGSHVGPMNFAIWGVFILLVVDKDRLNYQWLRKTQINFNVTTKNQRVRSCMSFKLGLRHNDHGNHICLLTSLYISLYITLDAPRDFMTCRNRFELDQLDQCTATMKKTSISYLCIHLCISLYVSADGIALLCARAFTAIMMKIFGTV